MDTISMRCVRCVVKTLWLLFLASVILMVAGQLPHCIHDLILTELHHTHVENRIAAVKR